MSLNTTPRTFVTAEVETAAIFNAEVRDAITGIQAAWTTWSPTLTNLTLGNGTLVSKYQRIGKNILFYFDLTLGSTSTVGAGPTFTWPVAGLTVSAVRAMEVRLYDTSAGLYYTGTTYAETTTAGSMAYRTGTSLSAIGATSPFTWATGDILHCHGTYEAA